MRTGLFAALAAAAAIIAGVSARGPAGAAEPGGGPQRVLPAGGLIGRMVYDAIGAPVAVVRDVVIVRDSGQALAVLEVLQRPGRTDGAAPSHVVAPLTLLRLPADGRVRLVATAPALAALPAIALPPTALAQGLMVPPPDAGPLRVIAPPTVPPPPQLAGPPD